MIPIAAVITMAFKIAVGRSRNSPGAQINRPSVARPPTTPASCVCAPAAITTGVRDALALTGNPWKKPVTMLTMPFAANSRLGSTGPGLADGQRARQDARVGQGDHGDAGGAGEERPELVTADIRHVRARHALRQRPRRQRHSPGRTP